MKFAVDMDVDGKVQLPNEVLEFLDIVPGRDNAVIEMVDGNLCFKKA